jgi:hypothetical protein
MFKRPVGNQRDLFAWLGVAKAAPQRLALASGGERTELIAVTMCAVVRRTSRRAGSITCTSSLFAWWVDTLSSSDRLKRSARTDHPTERHGAWGREVELPPFPSPILLLHLMIDLP